MTTVRRAIFVVGAIGVAVGACTLPSSTDFTREPTPDAGGVDSAGTDVSHPVVLADAAADARTDAGIDARAADAGDAGDAGIVDLLGSPDDSYFDNGSCGPDTGGYQASEQASTPAYSGAGACLVCRTSTAQNNLYTLDTQLPVHPRTGEIYQATAWVRRPPGSTDTTSIALTLRTHNGDFNGIDQVDSPEVALSDDYQLLSLTLQVTQSTSDMDVYVGTIPPADESPACFLIDDLVVWRSN